MNVKDTILYKALAQGRTLPAEWYTDPEQFEREAESIFAASWNYLGRVEQVAKPGDFLTGRVGKVPVVVVRDEAGTLRAYAERLRPSRQRAGAREERQPPHSSVPLPRLDLGSRRSPARSPTLPGAGGIQQGRLSVDTSET